MDLQWFVAVQHLAMSNNRSITLNFEVFPVCDFCFVYLSKFPVLDKVAFSWCDVICAPTIQEPFNCFTCLVAGKIDWFTASYWQFSNVRNIYSCFQLPVESHWKVSWALHISVTRQWNATGHELESWWWHLITAVFSCLRNHIEKFLGCFTFSVMRYSDPTGCEFESQW